VGGYYNPYTYHGLLVVHTPTPLIYFIYSPYKTTPFTLILPRFVTSKDGAHHHHQPSPRLLIINTPTTIQRQTRYSFDISTTSPTIYYRQPRNPLISTTTNPNRQTYAFRFHAVAIYILYYHNPYFLKSVAY
jgi:hypothetical protein